MYHETERRSGSMKNDRELRMRIFSLYAQARVAFQLGGDMLSLARRRAGEAMELLAGLERPGREEQLMAEELREYIK